MFVFLLYLKYLNKFVLAINIAYQKTVFIVVVRVIKTKLISVNLETIYETYCLRLLLF